MRLLKLPLVLLVWAAAVPAVAGPYEDATSAFPSATTRLSVLQQGNVEAQYLLGYMYDFGYGVRRTMRWR